MIADVPFIPKGYESLADAVARVGKSFFGKEWTGDESYSNASKSDEQIIHDFKEQAAARFAEACATAWGPDWWIRSGDRRADLGQIWRTPRINFEPDVHFSEARIEQLRVALNEPPDDAELDTLLQFDSNLLLAVREREFRSRAVARQIIDMAISAAEGHPPPTPWPSGYLTPDGELPFMTPEQVQGLLQEEASLVAAYGSHRVRWTAVTEWIKRECEAGDVGALIIHEGRRVAVPTDIWPSPDRIIQMNLWENGTAILKFYGGGGAMRDIKGGVLINSAELNGSLAQRLVGTDEVSSQPLRTGAPGRPTSRHLVEQEFKVRANAGRLEDTLADEAAFLSRWLQETHPNAAPMTERTVQNSIRVAYRQQRSASTK